MHTHLWERRKPRSNRPTISQALSAVSATPASRLTPLPQTANAKRHHNRNRCKSDAKEQQKKGSHFCEPLKFWWPRTESNRRHGDFQSPALPTELLGHFVLFSSALLPSRRRILRSYFGFGKPISQKFSHPPKIPRNALCSEASDAEAAPPHGEKFTRAPIPSAKTQRSRIIRRGFFA